LVATDGNLASTEANKLVNALKSVKMNALGQEEHQVWMKVRKDLAADAGHISDSEDPAVQRNYFAALSDNMYKLVKAGKPSEPVYYQHCPMARGGKGANWLSQLEAVKNPYYGAQMLTCGKTTETLQ